MTRAASIVLLALASGCAVDTEIGLSADVTSASAEVIADPAGDVVAVTMDVVYRTGEHTMEARELLPQGIDVLAQQEHVVTLIPERPPGFMPRVSPGQSRSATFTAQSAPGAATDPRRLCGAEALLVFRWMDRATHELGSAEATTGPVACD